MPGPIPKRSEERTRRNKTNEAGIELKTGMARGARWRAPDANWDPAVKKLYNGMKKSGMADFYEQADVEWIWLSCDELNDYRASGNKSAMKLQAVLGMFSAGLGITEGDRRRMQIELKHPQPETEDEVDKKRRELREKRMKKSA